LHTSAQVLPWQTVAIEPLGVTVEQCDAAVQWIAQDNSVTSGPQAISRLLVDAGSIWRPLGWMLRISPLRWLAEPIYRLIARNRHRMPGGTAACSLPHAQRRSAGSQPGA
jgi:predicted DCC family thiol-disulfide oxidoreductase YuxK